MRESHGDVQGDLDHQNGWFDGLTTNGDAGVSTDYESYPGKTFLLSRILANSATPSRMVSTVGWPKQSRT